MDSSIKQIISSGLSSLSNLFASDKSSVSALGVDIGTSAIKIVQLKKKDGKAILETYGSISLGPYGKTEIGSVTNLSTEDISKALVDVMKESNVTVNSGAIAIPSSSSLIFTISLPKNKATESQMSTIVPLEARKYIPVPISEISLDWFVIPEEAEVFENNLAKQPVSPVTSMESKIEILIVAIHNDILTKSQEILTNTNLKSDSFELEIFSSIRSSLSHDLSPVLLIDFGASKTKLTIIESGVVRVFHIVNRGSADITKNIAQSLNVSFTEAEKIKRSTGIDDTINPKAAEIAKLSVDYIFSDTNSVVLAYEKKYNKNISKVILTGGGSVLRGLFKYAISSFHMEVVYSNPFSKTEAPAFLQPVLETSGPEFSVALGLALRQLS
jgi:type IV pilus assembly protein PilM